MRILFAGGGTGGHLYPAIALAEEVLRKDRTASIAFVGTRNKIEARVVPEKGYRFYPIWISGFSRRFKFSTVLFPLKVIVALVQSFFVIRKEMPDVIVGTGGYVCGPVLFVGSLLGITTVIHESNSYPGVTTRLLAARVSIVFITFETTRQWIPAKATVELAGNPTRAELSLPSRSEGSTFFGLSPDKRTVFVFGGSLGAASINAVMPEIISAVIEQNVQVIWQTGASGIELSSSMQQHANVKVMAYVDRMDLAYAACDLVVCRSGATTLAELTRLGKPAVLIPYPFAAADHQTMNARAVADAGAAVLVNDAELKEKLPGAVMELLFDDVRLKSMSAQSRSLGRPQAGEQIVERMLVMAT